MTKVEQWGMTEHWDNIKRIESDDTAVEKWVFTTGTAVAESVLYKYPTYRERTVICCSTQSGCPVGCRFCGAGDYFVRSLTADEIVSQPMSLLEKVMAEEKVMPKDIQRLQIMFMSMGEPLLNLKQLIPALRRLYEAIPTAALLISTSAPRVSYDIVRGISKEIPTIGLQFSIHESTDDKRDELIPFKKKLSLLEIADEGVKWAYATGRRPYFNYCVHEGNNSKRDADRLLAHFDPKIWECTLSVVCERDESVAAANARQRQLTEDFMFFMLDRNYSTRMFDPAGQDDIGGGCGQLWFVQDWMKNNPDLARPSIGNGLPVVHTPAPAA